MDIWSQITKNIFQREHTRRPEADVPYPDGFRGELLHDAARCTACGTCAYVCSPSAIVIEKNHPEYAGWQYQLLQCTFCGRCMEYCPTGALSFDSRLPRPLLEMPKIEHQVPYTPCEHCGEPIMPLPRQLLEETYGSALRPEIEQLNRLCERCRKKVHGTMIKRGFTGQ
jgi:hydrogenase-4 component H